MYFPVLSTRLVLKVKYKADGSFDKYKARLVVRGFLQREGRDFYQTFTPTAEMSTFRVLAAEAAHHGWRIMHADVKNAFCNADIDVPGLAIELPNGITLHDDDPGPDRTLQLSKALYGLKQSPRLWFQDLRKHFLANGLTQCKRDTTLFKYKRDGRLTYVLVYVDDIIITGPSEADQDAIRDILTGPDNNKKYTVSQYDPLNSYLAIAAAQQPDGTRHLSMGAKIDEIADELPVAVRPLSPRLCVPRRSSPNLWEGVSIDSLSTNEAYCLHHYAHLVGAINYLCTCVRPDISHAISKLARHLISPAPSHAKHLNQLIAYLVSTRDYGIILGAGRADPTHHVPASGSNLEVFSDSNFADPDEPDLRATSGTVVLYRGVPIAWKCKRQDGASDSTHHAELYALHQSAKLAMAFRLLIDELELGSKVPTPIYVDNDAVHFTACSEFISQRSRHIKTRYFLVQDYVQAKEVTVPWLRGTHNPADLLTKALTHDDHMKHTDLILKGISQSTAPKPSGRGGVHGSDNPPGVVSDAPRDPPAVTG